MSDEITIPTQDVDIPVHGEGQVPRLRLSKLEKLLLIEVVSVKDRLGRGSVRIAGVGSDTVQMRCDYVS